MSLKQVRFAPKVVIHIYYQEVPCLQEYLAGWDECKKKTLMESYLSRTGSLVGFNYEEELHRSQEADLVIDNQLQELDNTPLYLKVLQQETS